MLCCSTFFSGRWVFFSKKGQMASLQRRRVPRARLLKPEKPIGWLWTLSWWWWWWWGRKEEDQLEEDWRLVEGEERKDKAQTSDESSAPRMSRHSMVYGSWCNQTLSGGIETMVLQPCSDKWKFWPSGKTFLTLLTWAGSTLSYFSFRGKSIPPSTLVYVLTQQTFVLVSGGRGLLFQGKSQGQSAKKFNYFSKCLHFRSLFIVLYVYRGRLLRRKHQ